MSAVPAADPVSKSASKKKRKNKKKPSDKNKPSTDSNGAKDDVDDEGDDAGAEADHDDETQDVASRKSSVAEVQDAFQTEDQPASSPVRNGDHQQESDTSARLDAMAKERDTLRAEVAELRKSLETMQERHQEEASKPKQEETDSLSTEVAGLHKSLETAQQKHEEEVSALKAEIQEAQTGKESAESQYRTLLGKVNTIRSQLGERLKADAEELARARSQIEELQQEARSAQNTRQELQSTVQRLEAERKANAGEIDSLRSRTNLSQSNWAKERDDLISREAYAREEFESAKQAMQDWEVLAMEERSLRENLSDRLAELEDQLASQRDAYERAAGERDMQNSTVEGLQRALQDIQDARKRELRELVENSQAQLDTLRDQAEAAKSAAATSAAELEKIQKDLERVLPFEKEVKEKNLLIGKLRHEAVILNDHLTKALRFLKRGKPEDNVDRHIVTNHFLHFLTLDRSDPKKFQILQLIAALLGWSEEQREQAGLARPGASNATLRVPLSPFRRAPSTPALTADLMPDSTGGSKESLAELWSEFLEREAQEGGTPNASRSGSFAALRSPSLSERPGSAGLGIKGSGAPTGS